MPDAVEPVSVVMPVRNAMPFLDAAIESILAQTYRNFELVIGDDASTDGSSERLQAWARRDPRIRLLRNDGAGLGPAGSANWVACAARHRLIARMDADDLALPERLAKQVRAFRDHPEAGIAGSMCDYIDANDRRILGRDWMIFRNPRCIFPCVHASLMLRRDIFERVDGYRRECDYWEDVDLFLRMQRHGKALILSDRLLRYLMIPTSSSQVSK
jgi:glycosyltransferase involved in cell wall biosynthesis